MRPSLVFLLLVIVLQPITTPWAAERIAASSAYADVSNSISLAADGDIVVLPPGSSTWATTLTISKSITLQGSGMNSTVITAATASTLLININPGSNKAIMITGIGFKGGNAISISGNKSGAYCLDKIRIDHCAFTDGKDNILSGGWVEGLIDHNVFLNCNRAILIVGDDNYSWERPIEAGTGHALFIEDNTFKQTNAGGGELNESVYHQEGARTVVRHNDFDGSEYTSYDYSAFDSHGNQMGYYPAYNWFRGQPLIEVYNNTFRYHHSYRVCNIRSGSLLFHDNAFTFNGGYSTEIMLTEEEGYKPAFSPLRTAWPAQDQINNAFFWNNTRNGSLISDVTRYDASDAVFIQRDRDYFMHAPQVSGGYEYYTGARKGGSTAAPTASDTGSMASSASGANAYYPYTPFTYPHPLAFSGAGAPESPKGLRIK